MENLNNLKQTIMEATKDGFLFYKHLIPNLQLKDSRTCKSTYNPFYNDNRPSLSIYYWNDRWWFKDFGDDIYAGDVFDFAAFNYGIDPAEEPELLLDKMMDDVVNFGEDTIDSWVQPNLLDRERSIIKVNFDGRKSENFTSSELDYWQQYGIDGKTLDSHQVLALDSYSVLDDENMVTMTKVRPPGKLWFAYKGQNYAKVYCPNPKSFWYAGQKPVNYTFGTPFDSYPEQQDIILTAGEKDALALIAHGFNAITLNSETADLPQKILKNLYESKMHICGVLYDLDDTGVKRAKDLAQKLKCPVVSLPAELREQGGKDISDYFKFGGTVEGLKQIIESAPPYVDLSPKVVRKSVRTAQQRLLDAQNMPEIQKMFDVFLQSGELGILFGDTGIGKSILAVAIADAVSRGVDLLSLENECEPCNVIYYDFELGDKQFQKRYSTETGRPHQFSESLFTDSVDFSELEYDRVNRFEKVLLDKVKLDIVDVDAKFIIFDNITALHQQSSSDVQVAMELMKLLKQLKSELNITILVLAHTPKRHAAQSLTINDLAGSKQLSNFADTVFAIGVSAADAGHRYIKQIKPSRSGELKYDKTNVLKCELTRDETDESFLSFKFIEFCDESSLLASSLDMEQLKDEAIRLHATVPGITIREIGRQIGVSKTTVGRWLQPDK